MPRLLPRALAALALALWAIHAYAWAAATARSECRAYLYGRPKHWQVGTFVFARATYLDWHNGVAASERGWTPLVIPLGPADDYPAGFAFERSVDGPSAYRRVVVPSWFVSLVLLAPPLAWLTLRLRRRRRVAARGFEVVATV